MPWLEQHTRTGQLPPGRWLLEAPVASGKTHALLQLQAALPAAQVCYWHVATQGWALPALEAECALLLLDGLPSVWDDAARHHLWQVLAQSSHLPALVLSGVQLPLPLLLPGPSGPWQRVQPPIWSEAPVWAPWQQWRGAQALLRLEQGEAVATSAQALFSPTLLDWLQQQVLPALLPADIELLMLVTLLAPFASAGESVWLDAPCLLRVSGRPLWQGQALLARAAHLPMLECRHGPEHQVQAFRLPPGQATYWQQVWLGAQRRGMAAGAAWVELAQQCWQSCLQQSELTWAARIAGQSGLPQLWQAMWAWAWPLVYQREAALLGDLLQAWAQAEQPRHGLLHPALAAGAAPAPLVPPAEAAALHWARLEAECVWRIEGERTPHKVEASLTGPALRPHLQDTAPARWWSLRASSLHQYDEWLPAQAAAAQALAEPRALGDEAAHCLARTVLGQTALMLGQPEAAQQHLQQALRLAERDQLPRLQCLCWLQLAWQQHLQGDLVAAETLLGQLQAWVPLPAGMQDSLVRAQAWLALDRGLWPQAQAGLPEPAQASVPQLIVHALARLGQNQDAAELLAQIQQRMTGQFYCRKWQVEARWVVYGQALRQQDASAMQSLLTLPWPDDEHSVLSLTAQTQALLARWFLQTDTCKSEPVPAESLKSESLKSDPSLSNQTSVPNQALQLAVQCQQAGLGRMARLLALLPVLWGDETGLVAYLHWAAQQQVVWDVSLLGGKAYAALSAWLQRPEAAKQPQAHAYARVLVAQLQSGSAGTAASPASPPEGLTSKEWLILQRIGQHYTNEQIAQALHVSVATVKTHINHLYSKLGLSSRAEAVHRAQVLAQGTAEPPVP